MLATATLAFGASAETPGTVVDEVPANFGLLADFNPEAITEDLSGVIGDHSTVTPISGSVAFPSIGAHANKNPEGVKVAVVEENGEKFLRFTNEMEYTYSQLYLYFDEDVVWETEQLYFTITLRLSEGFACNDGSGRAFLIRLVNSVQNNLVLINADELAANDYSDWTTLTFEFTPDEAPQLMRLLIFANPVITTISRTSRYTLHP